MSRKSRLSGDKACSKSGLSEPKLQAERRVAERSTDIKKIAGLGAAARDEPASWSFAESRHGHPPGAAGGHGVTAQKSDAELVLSAGKAACEPLCPVSRRGFGQRQRQRVTQGFGGFCGKIRNVGRKRLVGRVARIVVFEKMDAGDESVGGYHKPMVRKRC